MSDRRWASSLGLSLKRIAIVTLMAMLFQGCTSVGKKELSSVVIPHIECRAEAFTNVLTRLNAMLAASYSTTANPCITIDWTVPRVAKRADSPAIEAEMDRCIEVFYRTNALRDLRPVTLTAARCSIWDVLTILAKIEPRVHVRPSSSGAVVGVAVPAGVVCRAYPWEPLDYDIEFTDGPRVISAQEMEAGLGSLKDIYFHPYVFIHYAYALKVYILIGTRSDHRCFAQLMHEEVERTKTRRREWRSAPRH